MRSIRHGTCILPIAAITGRCSARKCWGADLQSRPHRWRRERTRSLLIASMAATLAAITRPASANRLRVISGLKRTGVLPSIRKVRALTFSMLSSGNVGSHWRWVRLPLWQAGSREG